MNTLRAINKILDCIFKKACVSLLLIFTLVVLLQILSRNYIKIPMVWTQEVSLLCFLWSVYMGTAIAIRSRQHYIVELFPSKFVYTNKIMEMFADLFIFSLIIVLIVGGVKFTQMGGSRNFISIPLSMAWLFVAMPLSGVAMFLFGVENVVDDFINFKKRTKGDVC